MSHFRHHCSTAATSLRAQPKEEETLIWERRRTTIDGRCWSATEAERDGGGRAEKFAQREESLGDDE